MTEKQEQQIQTAIRLPESFLTRLDKLAERMSQPGLKITRAEALRLSAYRGIGELEAENKEGKKR